MANYAASIVKKELDYKDKWVEIPISNVTIGTRTRLRVEVRNDMSTTQQMGIYWFIADPDGLVPQEYTAWDSWPYTKPGNTHQFIGGSFALDKAGKYTTWIKVFMGSPSDPVDIMEWYIGEICTVAETINGEILNKWINKSPEGSHLSMPAVVSPDKNTFEVGIQYKNTSNITITAGCEVVVTDPESNVRHIPPIDYANMSPGDILSAEYDHWIVDRSGDWSVRIRLLRSDGTELAKFEGVCLKAIGASGRIKSIWVDKDPEGRNLPIPASVDADHNTFEIGIEYENTSNFSINAGVEMIVRDPTGKVRATPPVDYAGMSPGKILRHNYNACAVNMGGEWTVSLRFITREGLVLDTFTGVCLNAVGGTGEIQLAWINKSPEGNHIAIPTEVAADKNTFEVGAQYKSNFSFDITAGIEVKVWDPDNILRASPPIDYGRMGPGDVKSKEYDTCQVDKEGPWTVGIKLIAREDVVLDTYETAGNLLFTASPEPAKPEIRDLVIVGYRVEAGV